MIVDGRRKQVFVVATCNGGTLGAVYGWLAAGTFLIMTPKLVSFFVLLSLVQQYMHQKSYQKIVKLVKAKETRENMIMMIHKINKQIEKNKKLINLPNLNWNKNPEIKQAAECLDIFENPPSIDGPINLYTLDFDLELEKMLKNLGLLQKTKAPSLEKLNEFLR